MIAPFTGNPDLDYFLSNLENLLFSTASGTGGEVPDYTPVGTASAYLFRYLHVKYADDNIGTGLSNSPTNKTFIGFFNSPSAVESLNAADYTWIQASASFSTDRFLFYSIVQGQRLDYLVALSAPNPAFVQDSGAAIDLQSITTSITSPRAAFAKSTASTLASNPVTVQTFGSTTFPETNTWGGQDVWQAEAPSVAAGEIVFKIDGQYNPATNSTTWTSPYLGGLQVGSLSAITANLGAVTAGSLNINNRFVVSSTGATTISSGSTGARVEIQNNVIKVFDANSVLRVKIGDLTA